MSTAHIRQLAEARARGEIDRVLERLATELGRRAPRVDLDVLVRRLESLVEHTGHNLTTALYRSQIREAKRRVATRPHLRIVRAPS